MGTGNIKMEKEREIGELGGEIRNRFSPILPRLYTHTHTRLLTHTRTHTWNHSTLSGLAIRTDLFISCVTVNSCRPITSELYAISFFQCGAFRRDKE